MSFVSYASNFEDVLLYRVFKNLQSGFYIDIGADHPVYSSTTKAFYDRGWHGVNVEPGPHFTTLLEARPRDTNVEAAITDHNGEVEFFVNEDLAATSSLFEKMAPSVASRVNRRSSQLVRALTLDSLVEEHVGERAVHFLKIDAEGAEKAIILSTDWSRFRPLVIVAESTEPFSTTRIDEEWSAHLAANGFPEVYFDGINTWFVREEDKNLADFFRIPVNLLDDFSLYNPQHSPKKKTKGPFRGLRRSIARRFKSATSRVLC